MATKKLYAVYDNSKPIGNYTSDEAAELLKISRRLVSIYASAGTRALGRYTFEVVGPLPFERRRSTGPGMGQGKKEIIDSGEVTAWEM